MQAVNTNNKCFVVWKNGLKKRIDPYFYKPEFISIDDILRKIKHKKIREISLDLKNGSTPRGGVFTKEGIPYFRSQDFNLFDFRIKQYVSPEFHKKISRSAIKAKDVLLAVVGATLGVVGYVPNNITEGNINQNVARIRVIDKEIDPKYLAFFLSSNVGQNLILRNATITTQAYLNNKQLGDIEIPIPPLEIQNKIIKIIQSAYDKKADKEKEAENTLNSIGDYVLKALEIKITNLKNKNCFTINSKEVEGKRLDPKGYLDTPQTILKAISKSRYKTKTLSELLETSIAGEWGEDTTLENNENYSLVKVLRNTNFDNQGNLNFDDVAERLVENKKLARVELKAGDILIEKSGGSPIQPVGRVALIENLKERFTFSNFLQCFRVKKECLPEYLFCFLKALYGLNYMEYLQNQTTGIKNLIMEEYLSIPIPVPPIDTQKQLANEFRNRLKRANELKTEAKNEVEKAKQEVEKIILGKK
ncbi:MAG: restriction endonuclease subunit S [Patescibacteria group bacterium]